LLLLLLLLLFFRSFGWLVGCFLFYCVGGGHAGGCGVCGDGSGDDDDDDDDDSGGGGGGGGGVNGGNIVSLHSCWLCNWPLGWSASMQINKELITTTTTTTTTSSSSSFLHANTGQTGYLAAIHGHKVYMITFIKTKYDAVLSGTLHISH